MNHVFRSLVICVVLGCALTGLIWMVWRGAVGLFGGEVFDEWNSLWFALIVGTLAAGGTGTFARWIYAPTSRMQTSTDVTAVKPAARKKRVRQSSQFEDSFARVTSSLEWLAVSRSLCRLLRLPKDQLLGKPIASFVQAEDFSAVERAFAQALTSNLLGQAYCRLKLAHSSADRKSTLPSDTDAFLLVRLDVRALKNGQGDFTHYACRVIDLTAYARTKEIELRSARRELALASKHWRAAKQSLTRLKFSYRDLYQSAPVMYFNLDNQGKLVTFNDTFLRVLGYERRELDGKNYSVLLAPESLTPFMTFANRAPFAEGECETQWCRKDGTALDVWLHTVPVPDDSGNFVRYRSAALDLTEKNRLANELRARRDELERTNQRLRIINGELEAFTHVVSHDLKEPLRTLSAFSHLLVEEYGAHLGPDGFRYIDYLSRASQRLGLMIDNLLSLSHAGRAAREPRAFNLLEVVATVRQDLVDLIQRKRAVILTDGSMPNVIGDTVRITQLLTNLVGNGLKYNTDPSPQVSISAAPCVDDPDRVTVAVRDNDIGIAPAYHQQIFAIFRRLHQVDEYEGTGAGLAICKKIVEGHGGRIWVESVLGEGATFFFTLPLHIPNKLDVSSNRNAQPQQVATIPRASSSVMQSVGAIVSAPRIVLVEDQEDVAMIIQKLGKRDGLSITWFASAEEAWGHLREKDADLLLLDVNLPGMNGLELCGHLRRLAHLKNALVVMFTPDQDPDQLEEYRRAGADCFLSKDLLCQPADWQAKLLELVRQIRPGPAS